MFCDVERAIQMRTSGQENSVELNKELTHKHTQMCIYNSHTHICMIVYKLLKHLHLQDVVMSFTNTINPCRVNYVGK